jgi:integrase
VEDYISSSGPFLEKNGFFETEIGRKTEQYGNIVHVFSTYESKRTLKDEKPCMRGINSFQLWYDGKRWWVRLHEKGGKFHEMPVHHKAEEYLDAYVTAAGIATDKKSFLFRSAYRRTGQLTARPMSRWDAFKMIKRRARAAGVSERIGCHTFRATGITVYLQNGGSLEAAQQMANHESIRTTKLYDRTGEEITLDEVERIVL